MLSELLTEHYALDVRRLELLDAHFGTEIHLTHTDRGKVIVKTLPLSHAAKMENEGLVTEFLHLKNIPVASLIKTKQGAYCVQAEDVSIHVQEFIEGETPGVNTAPDWVLAGCADLLGRTHRALRNYGPMKTGFGENFFRKSRARAAKRHYTEKLRKAKGQNDTTLVSELEERVRHLGRLAKFTIHARRLTYTNSHGDFHIGQIIVKDRDITVIDWTSACRLPACLEVIMSYVTADPACANGKIDAGRLKEYIRVYANTRR